MDVTEKRAYEINEFCKAFGVGRSFIYEQIADGKLFAKKIGRKNIITAEEADRWVNSLPDARAVA